MEITELKKIVYQGEKINLEIKKTESKIPKSIYETYSAFANTNGGTIVLGVDEDQTQNNKEEKYIFTGVNNSDKQIKEFWDNINNNEKVNSNILRDEDVFVVSDDKSEFIVIKVPRANSSTRPIYINNNLYNGTYKRNYEGDYHASKYEVNSMISDQRLEGNDNVVLDGFTMDDIDDESLRAYRQLFRNNREEHVWNSLDNKSFLEKLGGYRKDRENKSEGLTIAGLLVFGKSLSITEIFPNLLIDYRDETNITNNIRWNDRITYDGTWEYNIFTFFKKALPKLTANIKTPFSLNGTQRIDNTPIHNAIREALINSIVHADYSAENPKIVIVAKDDRIEFTNSGILKLPLEYIYKGGTSASRNPIIQKIFRLIGYGENAGSGMPTILNVCEQNNWVPAEIIEDTIINQVSLKLKMITKWQDQIEKINDTIIQNWSSIENLRSVTKGIEEATKQLSSTKINDTKTAVETFVNTLSEMPEFKLDDFGKELTKITKEKFNNADTKEAYTNLCEEIKKLKENQARLDIKGYDNLSEKEKQIIEYMQQGKEYSTKEIAEHIGLKDSRTRQILRGLTEKGILKQTSSTKNKKYIIKN